MKSNLNSEISTIETQNLQTFRPASSY